MISKRILALSITLVFTACNKAPVTQPTVTPTPSPAPVATAEHSPSATEKPKAVPVEFEDVTQQAGIRFHHYNGAFGKKYLPETNGSGCAFIDYDNDGWQDIILINSMDFDDSPKKRRAVMALYHNNQDG